ncbi:MAG: hypothetical protein ACI4F9_07205 [Lachnospiraceae bacterium]
MKGKKTIAVSTLVFILMLAFTGCQQTAKKTEETTQETATEKKTEATTAAKKKEVPKKVSDGVYKVENHYSIKLPKGEWKKTGSIEKGSIVFTSNKGEEIKVSYYEGKNSTAQRKKFPTSEEDAKKKILSSKKDSLVEFERISVGGKDDAIIRMYYAKKNFDNKSKYIGTYIISGADATYIAQGKTTSKKDSSYERLKECVKSMDLTYSFD